MHERFQCFIPRPYAAEVTINECPQCEALVWTTAVSIHTGLLARRQITALSCPVCDHTYYAPADCSLAERSDDRGDA